MTFTLKTTLAALVVCALPLATAATSSTAVEAAGYTAGSYQVAANFTKKRYKKRNVRRHNQNRVRKQRNERRKVRANKRRNGKKFGKTQKFDPRVTTTRQNVLGKKKVKIVNKPRNFDPRITTTKKNILGGKPDPRVTTTKQDIFGKKNVRTLGVNKTKKTRQLFNRNTRQIDPTQGRINQRQQQNASQNRNEYFHCAEVSLRFLQGCNSQANGDVTKEVSCRVQYQQNIQRCQAQFN